MVLVGRGGKREVVVVVVDLGRRGAVGARFWSFVVMDGVVGLGVGFWWTLGFLEREKWRVRFGVLLDLVAGAMRVRVRVQCGTGAVGVFLGRAVGVSSSRWKGIMRDKSTLLAFRGGGEILDGEDVGGLGHVVMGSLLSHVRSHAGFSTPVSSLFGCRVVERSFAVLCKPEFYCTSGLVAPCVLITALLFFLRRVFLFFSGALVRVVS